MNMRNQAGVEPTRRKAVLKDGAWWSEGIIRLLPGQWQRKIDLLIGDFEIAKLRDTIEIKP